MKTLICTAMLTLSPLYSLAQQPEPAPSNMLSQYIESYAEDISCSPDGQYIVLWCKDKKLRILKASSGKPLHEIDLSMIHDDSIVRVNTAPKGGYIKEEKRDKGAPYAHLKVNNEDGTCLIVDVNLKTGEYTKEEWPPSDGGSPYISPDGEYSFGEGSDGVFELGENEQENYVDMAYSPDSKYIAVATPHRARTLISVYNLADKKNVYTTVEPDFSNDMALTNDGKLLITASNENIVRITDIQREEVIKEYDFKEFIMSIAVDPKKNVLYVGLRDGSFKTLELPTP